MEAIHEGGTENYIYFNSGECWLDKWFSASGDTEDFIFYDEPDRIISEK